MLLVDYSEEYALLFTPVCGGFPLGTVDYDLSLLSTTTGTFKSALSTWLDLDEFNVLSTVVVNVLYKEVWEVVVPAIVQGRAVRYLNTL